MAKGKLNEVEKVYIQAKHGFESIESIAKTLGRTEKVVKAHLESLKPVVAPEPAKSEPAPAATAPQPNMKDQFIRSSTKERGVVIMTQAASELADEVKKNYTKKKYGKHIHKINE